MRGMSALFLKMGMCTRRCLANDHANIRPMSSGDNLRRKQGNLNDGITGDK